MIKRSDWQSLLHEMNDADRRHLGDPPTAEEVLAYSRGELSPEEEARVRALLVAYPELAATLTAPFPTEDDDSLSQEEVSRRWNAFQAPRKGKVLLFWRASAALAAGLALVFGGLLWREMSRGPRLLPEAHQLYADGQRGGSDSAVTLTGTDDVFVLIVPLYNPASFEKFRMEIVDASSNRLWRGDVQPRPSDDAFRIAVPRSYFSKGRYRVVLYGVEGTREEKIDTYSVRLGARQP